MTVPMVLDTDIGTDIDDAIALTTLLGSPTLRPLGLTTVYVDPDLRARLARELLARGGVAALPPAAGESSPRGGGGSNVNPPPGAGIGYSSAANRAVARIIPDTDVDDDDPSKRKR